jgi:predicted dehydrogenase
MGKLNVGIIGLGWPGERHAEAVLANPDAHLYAASDLSEERRAKFTKAYPVEKSTASYVEMLTDPAVDAVVVALPNALHFPVSLAALQAGKHVLCEKPPTLNADEMKTIRAEAISRRLIYFFGRQMRFSAQMRAAKELITAGRLGVPYFGKAVWLRDRGTPEGVGGWFTDKARSGGGVLIDLGVHAIDAVWYLMGTPRPVSVSGQVFRNFPHIVQVPVFDVEDGAYGMIRFENGAQIQFEVSWAANLTDDIPLDEASQKRELMNSTLYGPKATIRLRPLALFEDQAGKVVKVDIAPAEEIPMFDAQMNNFIDAILGRAEPINSVTQAVYLMEMLDAIYRSSDLGREVLVAPVDAAAH